MPSVLDSLEIAPLELRFQPAIKLTDDQLFEFCQQNRDWRIERSAKGEILIMPPAGGDSGARNLELSGQFYNWTKSNGSGVAFDASAGFTLPNGAMRSPDLAWVRRTRLRGLSKQQKQKFLPLCPDFVAEVRSPSDRLKTLQDKMEEYIDNGAQLGWLIDPRQSRVYVYSPGEAVKRLDNPTTLSGDPVLPGFVLRLREIWDPGW